MTQKKSYFKERTEAEIKKLNPVLTSSVADLVERIEDLDPNSDSLVISDVQIIPTRFFYEGKRLLTGAEASAKCRKHGNLLPLKQPRTLNGAYESHSIPLDMRVEAFNQLKKIKQQNNSFVGMSYWPVFGNDKLKRIVVFDSVPRGVRRFSYAENNSSYNDDSGDEKLGIKVKAFADSKRVRKEGATVVVEVPAESEKTPKYRFALMHVPYLPNNPTHETNYNLATVLSLKPAVLRDEVNDEALDGRTAHDIFSGIEFKGEEAREDSMVLRYSPLDIVGYLGIIKKQLSEEHNITALMYNPFPLISRHQMDFYLKLANNVLIQDKSLTSKDQLRHLHLAEKSILLSRAIGHFGHDDFSYWDPTRDGIYKNFDWKKNN
jgi:hypothetical protein